MKKILVIKNNDCISIYYDNSKLIINKNNKLFNSLNKLSNEEIINWYKDIHTSK